MRFSVGSLRPRYLTRVAVVALVAGTLGGCSSDTNRFAENPFTNPFGNPFADQPDVAATGSITPTPEPYAPVQSVAAQPLPAVGSISSAPLSAPATQAIQPVATTVASMPATANGVLKTARGTWSAEGGSIVTVGANDNIHSLANRYGVPANAIMAVNGLQTAQVAPGQQLTIPTFTSTTAAVQPKAVETKTVSTKPAQPKAVREVAETSTKPVRVIDIRSPKTVDAKPAVEKAPTTKVAAAPTKPVDVKAPKKPPTVTAQAPAAKPLKTVAPAEDAAAEPDTTASTPEKADIQTAQAAPAGPAFRWPVKGHVIKAFGQNTDGINISVPEGTAVKAAEDGVVAYAGNELKGYGNLVLIRHADGWVTAYAHSRDMQVKKGDTVKRGQVIASAGKTGDVTAPQVLFELRKSGQPVDPRPYLSGT